MAQPFVVQKFGGTSVGTSQRIQLVARKLAHEHQAGKKLVVVVSAMGQTTDELIDLARAVSQSPPHREMDMLLTAGERISMALLSMALADRGVQAVSLTGSQTGIITDEGHRRARIRRILGDRVRAALGENKIVIVAGFQGVSEKTKDVTTLGRGGSDTTAVALAAALGADACEIFTDVDGVFTADPRVVAHARLQPRVSYGAMLELASAGAGVLHPRSVALAKKFGIRLRVLNSLSSDEVPGWEPARRQSTEVGGGMENTEKRSVGVTEIEMFQPIGVTSDKEKLFVQVELARPTLTAALWECLKALPSAVLAPTFEHGKVGFYIDRAVLADLKKGLSRLVEEGFMKTFQIFEELAPVTLAGESLPADGSMLPRVVDVLWRDKVAVTTAVASPFGVTVGVALNRVDDAIRELHTEFFPATTSAADSSGSGAASN
ncbi:MAG: aspartate kinase [Bacteriovoracia bacterium]